MHRLQAAAGDEALHGIQQFQPIFQRRIYHALPLVETLCALGEDPFPANALGVDLQLRSVFGHAFPTDFGFRHLR